MMLKIWLLLPNGTLLGHPLSRKLLYLDLAMWSRLELLESEMKEKYIPTEHENVNKYRSQYNNKDVHMNYIMYNYMHWVQPENKLGF